MDTEELELEDWLALIIAAERPGPAARLDPERLVVVAGLDPKKLFNARLDSKTNRAIDVREGETVDDAAFAALIRDAVRLNVSKVRGL